MSSYCPDDNVNIFGTMSKIRSTRDVNTHYEVMVCALPFHTKMVFYVKIPIKLESSPHLCHRLRYACFQENSAALAGYPQ